MFDFTVVRQRGDRFDPTMTISQRARQYGQQKEWCHQTTYAPREKSNQYTPYWNFSVQRSTKRHDQMFDYEIFVIMMFIIHLFLCIGRPEMRLASERFGIPRKPGKSSSMAIQATG